MRNVQCMLYIHYCFGDSCLYYSDAVFYSRSENYHLLRLQLRVSSLLLAVRGAIEICDANGILGFL